MALLDVDAGSEIAAENRTGRRHPKLIWNPADQTLDVFNVKQDPLEVHPREVAAGDPDYKRETVMLANWFKSTDVGMGQSSMSKRDVEVLRSLGYVQ